jgi:hypothetical protein
MRQITKQAVAAFMNGYNFKSGNTEVRDNAMYLHGNKIAEWRDGELWITNAGWSSNTTKERLNGIPGVSIQQRNYVWYLNSEEWSGQWIKVER